MTEAWIGTSGFDYREWKPSFYPSDLPQSRFLNYYSSRFRTVELNNTFYQMPTTRKIESWSAATPAGFRFALKAPRRITHQERLQTPSDSLDFLAQTVRTLLPRLGAVLFQLPPFFKSDCSRLAAFLDAWPRELPAEFEFRHDSWFTEEVFGILEKRSVALCINDGDDRTTPMRITCGFTYLRLRRSDYSQERRQQWQERIQGWLRAGTEVYAYIKHEDNPDAPRIALEFLSTVEGFSPAV